MEDEVVKSMAEKYSKTPAQVLLRYLMQRNIIVIPKSVNNDRIESNFNVFDFELNENDTKALDALERGFRGFSVEYWKGSSFYPF